jgi:hypothetical protein
MNQPTTALHTLLYYRLIALWVLAEAMLGSIIFTFRIPVSGLVIGSCAVTCIALIGYYTPSKGAIIRATIIVAVFKMMLTPQAPPGAYVAVFFQGLLGEFLFRNKKFYRTACIILAILALTESAFQRIIIVTIIYGNDFWSALNIFINKLAGDGATTDYSFFIIFWYTAVHIVAGIFLGIWLSYLPDRIGYMKTVQNKYAIADPEEKDLLTNQKKNKRRRWLLLAVWILLTALYIQSFYNIGKPLLPSHMALRILLRSLIIVLTWHFLISPALKRLLHRWLQVKKRQWTKQVQQVLNLLPSTQGLISESWRMAGVEKGWRRIRLFYNIILANTFYATPKADMI